ncbi:MAG TPA: PEP-CTERM sorting domain-containing protein [Tepidisphaeraceae bacterium]|jgi:hypothetical protein|nr:PEP-CTERM sorting domain-containing protein [Tepidisphaeraceae bacterium]
MNCLIGLVSVVAGSVVATNAGAAVIDITPNAADTRVDTRNLGTVGAPEANDVGNFAARIGEFFAPGGGAYVMPFLLPTLPVGEVITAANLRTQLYSLVGTPADADLYGLGVRTDPTVLPGDYYQGTLDTTDAVLVQQSFLTAATPIRVSDTEGFVNTNEAGDAGLVAYLNSAYAGGANAGQYAFLRVNYTLDPIPGGNNAYELLTANAGRGFEKPLLTLTTSATAVPEPASLAIVGLAALTGLTRRRRAV